MTGLRRTWVCIWGYVLRRLTKSWTWVGLLGTLLDAMEIKWRNMVSQSVHAQTVYFCFITTVIGAILLWPILLPWWTFKSMSLSKSVLLFFIVYAQYFATTTRKLTEYHVPTMCSAVYKNCSYLLEVTSAKKKKLINLSFLLYYKCPTFRTLDISIVNSWVCE